MKLQTGTRVSSGSERGEGRVLRTLAFLAVMGTTVLYIVGWVVVVKQAHAMQEILTMDPMQPDVLLFLSSVLTCYTVYIQQYNSVLLKIRHTDMSKVSHFLK